MVNMKPISFTNIREADRLRKFYFYGEFYSVDPPFQDLEARLL